MKLYFNPMTRAMTTRLLVAELGADVDVEIVDMDFEAGEHKSAAYIEKHPLGQLPALELDDGTTIFETAAVCQYLAEQAPGSSLHVPPGDPRRGLYLTFLAYGVGSVEPAVMMTYDAEARGDEATAKAGRQLIRDRIAVYERQLGGNPWLLGEAFTAADVIAGSTIGWVVMTGRYEARGVIADYMGRFRSRPAIKAMFKRYYGG